MAEGSRPLYNLLLFQFKQRARSPSSGGPRGPGRAAPPSTAGRLCLLRLHTPAGRRPGLRGRAGTGSRGRAPGARPRLPCWGRGGGALRDAFPRHGHQIGTLPPDERGQVTTSSTSSVQGSSAKLVKPSLS